MPSAWERISTKQGVIFSGGEKQKMAIARAIYKDAPFVIMDEPTAALDPQAECEVLRALINGGQQDGALHFT